MEPNSFLYSRISSALALFFAQVLPERAGYPFARWIGRIIGILQAAKANRAVRANQWMISRKQLTARELDRAAAEVFRFAGYVMYDYYHHLGHPQSILSRVEFTPRIQEYFQTVRAGKQGTLFVLPHLGNFDFAGRAIALSGIQYQVLSYPQPTSGYRLQNRIRETAGVDVTPISISAMRQAVERLRAGGLVMTGLDRPLTATNYWPRFFGHPAPVPVAYIRLAMKIGIPVIVASTALQPSGKYLIDASEPIQMQTFTTTKEEIEKNAEAVLHCAERFILRAPQQWLMFYSVWPDLARDVP